MSHPWHPWHPWGKIGKVAEPLTHAVARFPHPIQLAQGLSVCSNPKWVEESNPQLWLTELLGSPREVGQQLEAEPLLVPLCGSGCDTIGEGHHTFLSTCTVIRTQRKGLLMDAESTWVLGGCKCFCRSGFILGRNSRRISTLRQHPCVTH